jgi:hypothetical protein
MKFYTNKYIDFNLICCHGLEVWGQGVVSTQTLIWWLHRKIQDFCPKVLSLLPQDSFQNSTSRLLVIALSLLAISLPLFPLAIHDPPGPLPVPPDLSLALCKPRLPNSHSHPCITISLPSHMAPWPNMYSTLQYPPAPSSTLQKVLQPHFKFWIFVINREIGIIVQNSHML